MAKTRACFIGNSFIARNDLSGPVKQRVTAGSEGNLGCELISISSAPLRTYLNKGEALERIQSQRFDDMGLQEQSTLPIKNSTCYLKNVHDFDALIRKAGVCTVLYMTWARRNAPQTQDALGTVCIQESNATGRLHILRRAFSGPPPLSALYPPSLSTCKTTRFTPSTLPNWRRCALANKDNADMIALGAWAAVTDDGKILLTKSENFEIWCLPGRHIENGESMARAMLHEKLEKTGIEIELLYLVGSY